MRIAIAAALIGLSACTSEVPNSAAGVGFNDYDDYREQREAALRGETATPPDLVVGSETLGDVGAGQTTASAAPVSSSNPGISDEQNFDAVSSRESIESDAERIARNAQSYTVVAPTALPSRQGTGGPNIVAYALATSHPVGQKVYSRSNTSRGTFDRACARYASSDQAQIEFLRNGGPERDRLGVDPDGDGFACSWDPTPFRAARGG